MKPYYGHIRRIRINWEQNSHRTRVRYQCTSTASLSQYSCYLIYTIFEKQSLRIVDEGRRSCMFNRGESETNTKLNHKL